MSEKKSPEILIPSEFARLLDNDWREAIVEGGRFSLKSHTVARIILIKAMQKKTRVLCGREFQNSITESVHQLFADLIEYYGLKMFQVTRDSIVNTMNGSDFIFKGVRHNMQSIKSIEGVDIFWGEESQTFSKESIEVITPTIRKEGSQLIWTMNRLLELDPIYERIVVNKMPNSIHINANYDVAEKYGWLPEEIKSEIEHDKKTNPGLYAHKWLGQPMSQIDDAIIGRDAILEAMRRDVSDDGAIEIGVDVARMGNDRTELVKRKGMKETGRKTYSKLRTTEVCDKVEEFAGYDKSILIKVDDTGVGCITEDTSVLTPDGWKHPHQLMPGDVIYSKDEDGHVTETTVASVREKNTEIIEVDGYKFSWAHQLPFKTRNNYDYKLGTWEQATNYKQAIFDTKFNYEGEREDFYLPEQVITMPYGGKKIINKEAHIDAEEFAIFLGWYASEGSIDRSSKCITITQKKTQHFDEIMRVMSYFGKVQVKNNGKSGGKDFKVFNNGLIRWIEEHCYKGGFGFKYKTVPRFIANNSKEVITSFLRAFRDGDGYVHSNGRNYYVTSSVNLVDDLTELIYKVGKSAGCYRKYLKGSTFQIEGRTATRTEDNYVVFEYSRNGYGIAGKESKVYKGKVYSIIINNDTRLMFTKVDGKKPFWTHNGGVTDDLKRRGYNVMPINFGAKPNDPDKYPNLISEAWFYMASIMDDVSLVQDNDLLMELSSRKWVMDSKGRRGVESKDSYKKRGYRSPDKADATILCFYTPKVKKIVYAGLR